MIDSKNLKLMDFDFDLPEDMIAKEPVFPRDASKLLVYKSGLVVDAIFSDIVDFVPEKTVFILNDTKVIKARLKFKLKGKEVEVFFVKQVSEDSYSVLVRPGKMFKLGDKVILPADLEVEVVEINNDGSRVFKIGDLEFNLIDYLDKHGEIPLPPYMKQENPSKYELSYQTVYAKNYGSIAAPTAGLHFTNELIEVLKCRGAKFLFVTLNVGLGTFQPVRVEKIIDHNMHYESFSITEETAKTLNKYKKEGYKLVSVGTTTLRVLQSSFNFEKSEFECMDSETNIFIYPGFENWVVDGLITNFHLPKSTLFMLIAAIVGLKEAKQIYEHAKINKYRFYSFGDANLLWLREKCS